MRVTVSEIETQETFEMHKSVIGILGSKGGIGATTFAINLACALSMEEKQPERVVLIDGNLQQPDAALMLAAQTEYSLVDLIKRSDAIEKKVFNVCSTNVSGSNGLRLISPPLDGSAAASNTLSEVVGCLPALTNFANTLIIDLPKHLDRHLVTTLDACDYIFVVLEANMASIAAAKRWLSIFEDLGYAQEKVFLVANRLGGKLKFVEQQLFMSFDGLRISSIPNAYSVSEACSIEGVPIVIKHPREAYSKAIKTVAQNFSQHSEKQVQNKISRKSV